MPSGPGCQSHAGILDEECKLTFKAKKLFIQAIKDELTYGTENLPFPPLFPCGDPIPPDPHAHLLELENEEKFPEFHKNIVGSYEKIACTLNMPSDFKILPICCPISLGFKLGVKIKIPNFPLGFIPYMIPNPPLIALKMKVMPPPKMIAKFPKIPSVPPPIPKFDVPPDIKMPQLFTFMDYTLAYSLGIPKLLAKLVGQMPKLVLKFPKLPDMFKAICDIAFESKIFGDIQPANVVQVAATKVLTQKVVEMTMIAAVGTTIGSSGGGVTGGIGRFLGYDPDDDSEAEATSVRDLIVNYAKECIDLSWGGGDESQDMYAQRMLYVEYPEPVKDEKGVPQDRRCLGPEVTINKLKDASSCGLLARACLFAGGASYVFDSKVDMSQQDASVDLYYDFFKDRYAVGQAIAGICAAAKAKGAEIPLVKGDLPALQRGDIIIVHDKKVKGKEHAAVLIEDYSPGSFVMTTVEGGQSDPDNGNRSSAIKRKDYVNGRTVPNTSDRFSMYADSNGEMVVAGRHVLKLIDGEILCTSQVGSDMRQRNGSINTNIANDGPGDGYQEFE